MFTPTILLTDNQLEQIHAAVLRILSEAGMRFESERLLGYLERGGARIDSARRRAFFPPEMIERHVQLLQPSREPHETSQLISRQMGAQFTLDFGTESFFLYDWPLKDRRQASEQDIIELMHLGEVLPEVGSVGLPVLNAQTDQRLEALEAVLLLLRHTRKHRGAGVRTPAQIPYMIEIDAVFGHGPDDPHFMQTGRCMISPLSFGSDAAGIFEALLDAGWDKQFWVATMPLAGGTGPVTAAGSTALMCAETLGGWLLAKCLNPDAQVQATVISGSLDMRRACAAFSPPEAIVQDIAAVEYFRRRLGMTVGFDPGYTDAKVPGLQCAWEKCFKQMAYGMYLGPTMTVGSLEGAATFSPTQAMLEIDLNKALWRFYQGLEVSDETLAVEEIIAVCAQEAKSFLQTEHTLRHHRDALFQPEFLRRGLWRDGPTEWREANTILDEADAKWRAALERYEPPPVDEAKLAEVERIVSRARRELCH